MLTIQKRAGKKNRSCENAIRLKIPLAYRKALEATLSPHGKPHDRAQPLSPYISSVRVRPF